MIHKRNLNGQDLTTWSKVLDFVSATMITIRLPKAMVRSQAAMTTDFIEDGALMKKKIQLKFVSCIFTLSCFALSYDYIFVKISIEIKIGYFAWAWQPNFKRTVLNHL